MKERKGQRSIEIQRHRDKQTKKRKTKNERKSSTDETRRKNLETKKGHLKQRPRGG